MKTTHTFVYLACITLLTAGYSSKIHAGKVVGWDNTNLVFTASEIHPDEVLLQWRGNFHADDFKSFIVSKSVDGENFQLLSERALPADDGWTDYSIVTPGDGAHKLFYKLSGQTEDGEIVDLKTICLPMGNVGLTVVPHTSNSVIYLTAKKVCEISIFDMDGQEISQFTLNNVRQTLDISSYTKGKYQIKTNGDHDHSYVIVEKI